MLFSQIRQYVKGILANSFINKSTLDKLGEDNNGLTFNGNNIEPPQELTSQQMQKIKDAFVIDAPRNGYPVLFDETGAEHFVGWYKLADGTKKPVYQKTVIQKLTSNTGAVYPSYNHGIPNVETIWYDAASSMLKPNANESSPLPYVNPNFAASEVSIYSITSTQYTIGSGGNRSTWTAYITFKYTKTTDTPI